MARPLSPDSRALLAKLKGSPKTIDQLAASTGIGKKKLAKVLWDLRDLGWVRVAVVLRKSRWRVAVYRLARRVPPAPRAMAAKRNAMPEHVAMLYAAFGIGLPKRRMVGRRARTVDDE